MNERESIARAPRLPEGFEYAPEGNVLFMGSDSPIQDLVESRHRDTDESELDSALGDFATAAFLLSEAQALVDKTAATARSSGATWSEIGQAAGVTPQTAWQRWSAIGNIRHNERRRQRLARNHSVE